MKSPARRRLGGSKRRAPDVVRAVLWLATLALGLTVNAANAAADLPNGPGYLRLLGARAQEILEPQASSIGALVRVPSGANLAALGLQPFVSGFARLRGTSDALQAFATSHPGLPLEVAPPPHLLLNRVGQWTRAGAARAAYGVDGTGVLVGVADTGVDFTLADFDDPSNPGHTRIAWLLDLTVPPSGTGPYRDLEAQFGGAVYAAADLDAIVAAGRVPSDGSLTDTVGHGTHVASIAAGNGGLAKEYVGLAPKAQLVIARITTDETPSITTDNLLLGAQFLFNRADEMKLPIAVNLSIGSDFGPHDGTLAWEEALAGFVGPTHPGRALVVAAGNSGDIALTPVHASVFVPPGGARRIPIATLGGTSAGSGEVEVWITMRAGADLAVGLDGPNGTWIAPVAMNQTGSASTAGGYSASVENGSGVSSGQIPANSHSAIVAWTGNWPAGDYSITLTGHGVADLYVEGAGDALDANGDGVGFVDPVREGTINLPATNAGLIAVGCTVNRPSWTSIAGGFVTVGVAPLDARGGYALDSNVFLPPVSGDVCWFSSAGPTVAGVPKPEISAPGGLVIAAMSQAASPSAPYSIFNNPDCPPVVDGGVVDPRCMQVDATHAVAAGTSMSAPQAAAAAALLFERDPTLTQDKILALLQAGAHFFRTGFPAFEDQGGPGELDLEGSLAALDQMRNPALVLPSRTTSWLTVSADELSADGSTPLTAILELRTADGAHRADFFDPSRLVPVVLLDGKTASRLPALERRGPGVWLFTVTPPPGLGGHTLTVGATFDGGAIVTPKSLAIATDVWTSNYPARGGGSCALASGFPRRDAEGRGGPAAGWYAVFLLVRGLRRRRYCPRSETTQPCGSHA